MEYWTVYDTSPQFVSLEGTIYDERLSSVAGYRQYLQTLQSPGEIDLLITNVDDGDILPIVESSLFYFGQYFGNPYIFFEALIETDYRDEYVEWGNKIFDPILFPNQQALVKSILENLPYCTPTIEDLLLYQPIQLVNLEEVVSDPEFFFFVKECAGEMLEIYQQMIEDRYKSR